ncbi:hypothetical protein [Trinickia symbiotica]|nr:hypothetical protein [Trinickia symbiotica]
MKLIRRMAASAALVAIQALTLAHAGLVNDVPSCYGAFHLTAVPQPPDRLVYILIDQTVELDATLQQSVIDNIDRLIQPGSKFVIAEFSAFSQGRYLQVVHTGVVESPLPENAYSDIPIAKAPQIRACFGQQRTYARRMAATTAKQVLGTATSSFDHSEIMAALQTVGQAMRADSARSKVLFVVTDGLEYSSVASFYSHNTVRDINPATELSKARSSQMLADLAGAKVYVLGGAMMPPAKTGTLAERNGYRDAKTLRDLKAFWQGYFQESNASLIEFGEPSLVEPVSY